MKEEEKVVGDKRNCGPEARSAQIIAGVWVASLMLFLDCCCSRAGLPCGGCPLAAKSTSLGGGLGRRWNICPTRVRYGAGRGRFSLARPAGTWGRGGYF